MGKFQIHNTLSAMTGSQTCWPSIKATFWYITHIILALVVEKVDNKILFTGEIAISGESNYHMLLVLLILSSG